MGAEASPDRFSARNPARFHGPVISDPGLAAIESRVRSPEKFVWFDRKVAEPHQHRPIPFGEHPVLPRAPNDSWLPGATTGVDPLHLPEFAGRIVGPVSPGASFPG